MYAIYRCKSEYYLRVVDELDRVIDVVPVFTGRMSVVTHLQVKWFVLTANLSWF